MSRNGPLALIFHALFIAFILAPIVIVCVVAFTPEGYLSLPTNGFSLRWFRAIADYPEFVRAFRDSLWLAATVNRRGPANSSVPQPVRRRSHRSA